MEGSGTVFPFPGAASLASLPRNVGTNCRAHQPTDWSPGALFLETKRRTRITNHSFGIVPGLGMAGAVDYFSLTSEWL